MLMLHRKGGRRVNDKIVLLTVALLFLYSAPAFGDAVTMREAINRALEQNHLLQAAALQQSAAEEEAAPSSRTGPVPFS